MSAHKAKTVRGESIPGTWRAVCSCGWQGTLHGARGARAAASNDRYLHEFERENAAESEEVFL